MLHKTTERIFLICRRNVLIRKEDLTKGPLFGVCGRTVPIIKQTEQNIYPQTDRLAFVDVLYDASGLHFDTATPQQSSSLLEMAQKKKTDWNKYICTNGQNDKVNGRE